MSTQQAKVLGIDPGLTRCGLGVVTVDRFKKAQLVEVGVEGSTPDFALEDRLFIIHNAIVKWCDKHQPDAMAIERVFYNQNVSTAMATAQVVGLAMVEAKKRDIPVELFTPSQVKSSITGHGKANKDAVTKMVMKFLKLKEVPRPADAADSLAIALTYAWRRSPQQRHATANTMTIAQQKWIDAEMKLKARGK
ncbi:MAG: crossover junction endodeoxyribonuclease RuvC [Micrococcaceae bacterium]